MHRTAITALVVLLVLVAAAPAVAQRAPDRTRSARIADLTWVEAEQYLDTSTIVLGGARKLLGMPLFADKLTPEKVKLIQAYVLSRAEAARR